MMTPRSSATHAPGSSLIPTDALSPKTANFIKNGWDLKDKSKCTEKIRNRENLKFPIKKV